MAPARLLSAECPGCCPGETGGSAEADGGCVWGRAPRLVTAPCRHCSSQEQRLKFLKQQDQRQQQQAAEQEKLRRLREVAENQEAKLKKVRALKGHVEQKRLSNGKLGERREPWLSGLGACLGICGTCV